MADTDHRMAAIEIKVLFAFIIPYIRAFCFYNGDIVDGIYSNNFMVLSFTALTRSLKEIGFQSQACFFIHAKHQVHILHCLPGCSFQ